MVNWSLATKGETGMALFVVHEQGCFLLCNYLETWKFLYMLKTSIYQARRFLAFLGINCLRRTCILYRKWETFLTFFFILVTIFFIFFNYNFIIFNIAEEDKKLNATYIISVARKLGCSIFLLPEDIIEVWDIVVDQNIYSLLICVFLTEIYGIIKYSLSLLASDEVTNYLSLKEVSGSEE